MMESVLSIVTGTRNRHEDLCRLVFSVVHNTAVPYELIIADASDGALFDSRPMWFSDSIIVVPERPRKGFSAGYNAAIGHASGEFIIWLNDDAEVLPGYDTAASAFMEANPQIGLGALYYQERGGVFHVNAYFGDMTYANFGIMRRDFFNEIGGFDEDLPMYGSDNAIAFKVLLAGKGIAGIPDARIIHHATDDVHRRENDDYGQRCRDAEILADKYGPHMEEMKATYARLGCEVNPTHDQTPGWLIKNKVSA